MKSVGANPVVRRFVELVIEYTDLIESGTRSRTKLFRQCILLLPEIFSLSARLPRTQWSERILREKHWVFQTNEGYESLLKPAERACARSSRYRATVIPSKKWWSIFRRLETILGDHNLYHAVFDPFTNKDAIGRVLSDDLADIWRDLKEPLLLFQLGEETAVRHAVRDWANLMESHWGIYHFPDAIKAIMFTLNKEDLMFDPN